MGNYRYVLSYQVEVSSSGVGEAAGNVFAVAATTVAAANRFRGRDLSNLNLAAAASLFTTNNENKNPFDSDSSLKDN